MEKALERLGFPGRFTVVKKKIGNEFYNSITILPPALALSSSSCASWIWSKGRTHAGARS